MPQLESSCTATRETAREMYATTRESPLATMKSLHAVIKPSAAKKKSEVYAYFAKDPRKARVDREGFMEETWAQRKETKFQGRRPSLESALHPV